MECKLNWVKGNVSAFIGRWYNTQGGRIRSIWSATMRHLHISMGSECNDRRNSWLKTGTQCSTFLTETHLRLHSILTLLDLIWLTFTWPSSNPNLAWPHLTDHHPTFKHIICLENCSTHRNAVFGIFSQLLQEIHVTQKFLWWTPVIKNLQKNNSTIADQYWEWIKIGNSEIVVRLQFE